MSYANLLLRLPEELIRIFRKYEQEKKKEINTHWSVVFNKTCLSEKTINKLIKLKSNLYVHSCVNIATFGVSAYNWHLAQRTISFRKFPVFSHLFEN